MDLNNEVRIISGKWKGRKLRFPGDRSVRPTLDRARVTLFNWLAGEIEGRRCLDLFAGSGALGFEACSRGAAQTTLVENDPPTVKALRENLIRFGDDSIHILQMDSQTFLHTHKAPWDLVFLDPPYDSDFLETSLTALRACLPVGASVYCETREPLIAPLGYLMRKQKQLSETCMSLLARD